MSAAPKAHSDRLILRVRAHPVSYLRPLLMFSVTLYPAALLQLARCELRISERFLVVQQSGRRFRWPHAEIDHVSVQQSPLARLFDYGTLLITHRDGAKLRLLGIREAVLAQRELESFVEIAILGRPLDPAAAVDLQSF